MYSITHSSSLRFAAHFLTVFVAKGHAAQFLMPIIHRQPTTSEHKRILFIQLAKRNDPFLISRNTVILSSKHPAVSLLSTQGVTPQRLGYRTEQWHKACTALSTQESVGSNVVMTHHRVSL